VDLPSDDRRPLCGRRCSNNAGAHLHGDRGQFALDGKPLGRIWSIGPQRTSYVPGVWLEARDNQVIVLDLLGVEHPMLSSLRTPILDAAVRSRVTNN
jgi:hypothetical protein